MYHKKDTPGKPSIKKDGRSPEETKGTSGGGETAVVDDGLEACQDDDDNMITTSHRRHSLCLIPTNWDTKIGKHLFA